MSAITREVAEAADVDENVASLVIEEFLLRLHRLEYEKKYKQGGLVENIWSQLSDRAFFHLLGFFECNSENSCWETGYMNEYLGRMPPCERWGELSEEMKDWKKSSE